MKKTIKLLLIMFMSIIVFTACDPADSSVDRDNVDMAMIEKYVQSDSTIISQDYPIFKKDQHEYVFNSKNELIAKYYNDYKTGYLIILLGFLVFGFGIGYSIGSANDY